ITTTDPYLPANTTITLTCTDATYPFELTQTVQTPPTSGNATTVFVPSTEVPAGFTGAVTVTITPPTGGSIPVGTSVDFGYYQIPNGDIALDLEIARPVEIKDATGTVLSNNTLVALGAVHIIYTSETTEGV
ncbi:MAG: hypothetical protein ACKO37_07465, partial [Vampirovibrionales bacterium]